MNYKLFIGRCISKVDDVLKKSSLGIVKRFYPWGRDFVYDLKRLFPAHEVRIIVDAGANAGSVSLDFAFHFPKSQVLAFEPVSSTYNRLAGRVLKFKNIKPIQMALGEGNYQVDISLSSEDTINSISSQPSSESTIGRETIVVGTLDKYVQENDIPGVDILKIDVEGFEFKVLDGANQLIRNSIKAIVLEVGYQRGNDKVHFSDVENYLENRGFQCCGVYDLSKSRDKRRLYYSNNLYIRKNLI